MNSVVRPFQLLSAQRLADTQAAFSQTLQAWCTDWRPLAPIATTLVLSARGPGESLPESQGLLAGNPAGAFVWVATAELEAMASWLFNTEELPAAPGTMAHEVASDALRQLLQAWTGNADATLTLASMPLPSSAHTPGLPVACMAFTLGNHVLRGVVRLPDSPAEPRPVAPAAPSPLKPALMNQRVTLSADLGEVEIDLHALSRLSPGDVIRFETGLDAPLRLRVDGKVVETAARAHPGMLGGHRALEIVNDRKNP